MTAEVTDIQSELILEPPSYCCAHYSNRMNFSLCAFIVGLLGVAANEVNRKGDLSNPDQQNIVLVESERIQGQSVVMKNDTKPLV